MSPNETFIERRAVALEQTPGQMIYLFSLGASEVLEIADISRISRDDTGNLIGYQRAEVKKHIDEITEYLNSDEVLFPNAIILALPPTVRFRKSRGPNVFDGFGAAGTLEIPVSDGEPRPAFIVDGQQRVIALSKSNKPHLPVPVAAFVADTVGLQRDQFLRVNTTRPLPRGLVTELLPIVSTPLPTRLAARQVPSSLVDLLNRDPDSPFHSLIRRASTGEDERKYAVITDTSLVKAIEESLNSPGGSLFPFRNLATGETDIDSIWRTLTVYWAAVRDTFPDAWGRPPTTSRLMHGVGIRSMGRLMDRIMNAIDAATPSGLAEVHQQLEFIRPICRWTEGTWEELDLAWNELQNVPKHIRMLSNLLVRTLIEGRRELVT